MVGNNNHEVYKINWNKW